MVKKSDNIHRKFAESEIGTVKKGWKGRIKVALVYPNTYHVGMSNLGFHAVYRLINAIDDIVCERSFLPEGESTATPKTIESGKSLSGFDIIAFSVSYENDYPHILSILGNAGIPLQARDRNPPHPLVMAGGVACFLNPEPISRFIDCFLIGEAEPMLPRFLNLYDPDEPRDSCLKALAREVPGIYVPACYKAEYDENEHLDRFEPICDVPKRIERVFVEELSAVSTCSAIITPHTTFDGTFLIEVARGCPHGCRFCSAGFVYRPPRFRPLSLLEKNLKNGLSLTSKIGLVGAAVSDHPEISELCKKVDHEKIRISFSSLRVDALTRELISVLGQSNVKTATIAPDGGSQRMRNIINKNISEQEILDACEALVENGIPNLKLYFMVGLPTETPEDVEAIVTLCKRIKHRFLKSSRIRKQIGEITVSLNCFVPKPSTPFQWTAMDDAQTLREKIKRVKEGLRRVANIRVHSDLPRWAHVQGLLSRGDRKVGHILALAHENKCNWAKTLKASPINPDYYVLRERPADELFPWDFIDHGIEKSFLFEEYQKALKEMPSPPCPMKSCSLCGVCMNQPEKRT